VIAASSEPPQLAFALAQGQNHFFVELAEALCFELDKIGALARIYVGEVPEQRPGLVHVFLPPHEFVALSQLNLTPAFYARSIVISTEQPDSSHFTHNVDVARHAGAVFDINQRAVRAYRAQGIEASLLQLGYTEFWDRRNVVAERDIDILFMGRHTERRTRVLASCADIFERFRCRLLFSDNSQPNARTTPAFLAGDDKRALLARAKLLINVHAGDEPYFEWLRVVEGICAGCVVVSEHSTDISPLRWGEHVVSGRPGTLGLLAAWLLEDHATLTSLQAGAYELLRDEFPLAHAADALLCAARRVDGAPIATSEALRSALRRARSTSSVYDGRLRQPQPTLDVSVGEGCLLRALNRHHHDLLDIRRQLDRLEMARARPEDPHAKTLVVAETPAWNEQPSPAVSIVIPLYNHRETVLSALESVARLVHDDWEVIVVDDGSTDRGGDRVREWLDARPEHRCRLVRHEINRGLPHARNTGIDHARGPLVLMLDADNELRRFALSRLIEALDADANASFAYGILERFSAEGPTGLLSVFPWDPERLRGGNFIDALALIRADALHALHGYSDDARLYGWEDYDLWVRMAESGRHGTFVPEIIARYRVGNNSMISLANISGTDAFAAIAEHAPKLMHDLVLPG
jgi:hypothetical protein